MNEDYSDTYDKIQKRSTDEAPDLQEESDAPLYDRVHEDSENDLYATRLESQEYEYLSPYVSKSDTCGLGSQEFICMFQKAQ